MVIYQESWRPHHPASRRPNATTTTTGRLEPGGGGSSDGDGSGDVRRDVRATTDEEESVLLSLYMKDSCPLLSCPSKIKFMEENMVTHFKRANAVFWVKNSILGVNVAC